MSAGYAAWLLFVPALGPIVFSRFDLVPAALAATALLALTQSRTASAGALSGLGAAFKLWPAVGLPALLVPLQARGRARALAAFLGAALVLALATAAAAGWGRWFSPLVEQAERGLQIEAFAALPLLWARYFDPGGAWSLSYAACKCTEIFGPGVGAALAAAAFALLLGGLALAAMHVRAFVAPAERRTPALAALLTALGILVWLVAGRVFSPQYLIWLAAPLAVLGALAKPGLAHRDVALFVAACVLTQAVFPFGYAALVIERHPLQAPFLVAMTLRDVLLLVLGARLAGQLWRASSP
jgi:hypothetical protein